MKIRTIVPIIIVGLIISCAGIVLANKNEFQEEKILTNEKISGLSDTFIRIEDNKTEKFLSKEDLTNKANDFLEKININKNTSSKTLQEVQYYDNILDNTKEAIITTNSYTIVTNAETGNIISYVSNNTNFQKNTLAKNKINEIALEIFKNLEVPDSKQYVLKELTKFDEEIWRVSFSKQYEQNLFNIGESVNISFAPQTKEIVSIAINNIPYANNPVNITEVEAKEIAQKYLEKSVANDMEVSIDIIRPNHFYSPVNDKEVFLYKEVNTMRKAYVCTFNNDSKSRVYIDASTGEILGGDMILGGEY